MTPQDKVQVEPRQEWLGKLESFIDLPSYLGQRGYEVQRASAEGIAMANPATGDALVVKQNPDREGWTFENIRDAQDRGSFTDFVMRRDHASRTQAAERVIVLSDRYSRDPEKLRYVEHSNTSSALQNAKADYSRARLLEKDAAGALEKVGIPKGTLDEWRFGSVKSPEAFAKVMADPADLWASKYRATDRHLVITEQPIDAMAFEKIRGGQTSCYLATGKELSDEVKKKIAHVLCEVPRGVKVVLAFGRDERGQQLADQVRALAPTVRMERQAPEFGSRWSTQMQLEQRHERSLARHAPTLGGGR